MSLKTIYDFYTPYTSTNISNNHLYIITANSKQYKIGVTTNPKNRIEALQIGHPDKLHYILIKKDNYAGALESSLHKYLNTLNRGASGEWFTIDRILLYEILFFLIGAHILEFLKSTYDYPKEPAKQAERLIKDLTLFEIYSILLAKFKLNRVFIETPKLVEYQENLFYPHLMFLFEHAGTLQKDYD